MKANGKVKGFTLVELIVVIAIIGVLAGLLVPSLIGYINKANRRVDATNAKVIYDDIMMILYTDDTKYKGYVSHGVEAMMTPGESWANWSHGSSARTIAQKKVSVNTPGSETPEEYDVCVVAYMDGMNLREDKFFVWYPSDDEEVAFTTALKKFYGMPERTSGLKKSTNPVHSKKYEGYDTNRWFITMRADDPTQIEIFVGDKENKQPRYRLYPNCCVEYR